MTRGTKRRPITHVRGEAGIKIVTSLLPKGWVVREVTPDYGLDLHIEVFDSVPGEPDMVETLGEHFFAQVKTVRSKAPQVLTVSPRGNVAKGKVSKPDAGAETKDLQVLAYTLETSEVATIELMGAGVPVLLVVVREDVGDAFYVCLNDYINKIILPTNPTYRDQETITIHIPTWNRLNKDEPGFGYVRLLAKRAKFYSSFSIFHYQNVEIQRGLDGVTPDADGNAPAVDDFRQSSLYQMIDVFIESDTRLDIWEPCAGAFWAPLTELGQSLRGMAERMKKPDLGFGNQKDPVFQFLLEVDRVFKSAALMSRMYEELCREWRLPTFLADLMLTSGEK